MDGVQETLFDRVLTGGRGSPKIQYSKLECLRNVRCVPNRKNILWETNLQLPEKKTACDKLVCGVNTTVALALAYQRLGYPSRKYHARV
jgi:hypothetical protein